MVAALARKLKFLPARSLLALHHNPSFNVERSQLRASLHLLQPPLRTAQVKSVMLGQFSSLTDGGGTLTDDCPADANGNALFRTTVAYWLLRRCASSSSPEHPLALTPILTLTEPAQP